MRLNPQAHIGQFILSRNLDSVLEGWDRFEEHKWCLSVLGLPVRVVENGAGQKAGWCVGYPLNNKEPWSDRITIQFKDSDSIDMHAVEEFYNHTGGKFILVLLQRKEEKLFIDPYGSLGVVFSTSEPMVASTTTLITHAQLWDREIINTLNMPESGLWYPSGTTPKKEVKRLLPNHCLNLNDRTVSRHWPKCSSDLVVESDTKKSISTITSCLRTNIEAVTNKYPVYLSLTAGRDARMLLACAQDFLPQVSFFTFSEQRKTVDMHIASKLSKKFNLSHTFIPVQYATEEEMLHWLDITGHTVSGAIWKIHKSLQNLDQDRVLLPGIAGEVGRSFYWKHNDNENKTLSAKDLLSRAQLPDKGRLLRETEKWLSELSGYNAFNILDLFYIEQRLGCWAAPQHYGNTTSLFEFSPFNHRRIFLSMMRLPYEYRKRQELANDVCRNTWPELLDLPFNEFTGLDHYVRKAKGLGSRVARKIRRVIRS